MKFKDAFQPVRQSGLRIEDGGASSTSHSKMARSSSRKAQATPRSRAGKLSALIWVNSARTVSIKTAKI
jgi:hypothetical protein